MSKSHDLNAALDRLLQKPYAYAALAFLFARAHDAKKFEAQVYGWLGAETGFPFLRVLIYTLCALVYAAYAYRYFTDRLPAQKHMLWAVGALFAALWACTLLHLGDSGYHIDWHAGFALMLMLDMGLQRERDSTLSAFSAALSLWLLLNLVSIAAYPRGYLWPSDDPFYAPEWLLGTRVYYYRIAFAALGFEAVRAQAARGRWTARTYAVLALVALTVALERGGNGVMGFALLTGLLLLFNRRALPRYALPAVFALLSVALFLALRFDLPAALVGRWLGENKSVSLSARVEGWRKSLALIAQHPLTGIGLRPIAYSFALLGNSHTHNQLLELLLHGGVLALIPYLAMIALATREALRYRRFAAAKTAALLLGVYLFLGATEIFHNDPIYYPLFILVSRADCLSAGGKRLPRISAVERVRRDRG